MQVLAEHVVALGEEAVEGSAHARWHQRLCARDQPVPVDQHVIEQHRQQHRGAEQAERETAADAQRIQRGLHPALGVVAHLRDHHFLDACEVERHVHPERRQARAEPGVQASEQHGNLVAQDGQLFHDDRHHQQHQRRSDQDEQHLDQQRRQWPRHAPAHQPVDQRMQRIPQHAGNGKRR